MSGTIWLITEDETDYQIVKRFIDVLNVPIDVRWLKPHGNSGGISRLLSQLEELIATAQKGKSPDDCIAVLHDADVMVQPDRTKYDRIKEICKYHNVKHIIANDEIESWLLSDEGVCKWLGIKLQNYDSMERPSSELNSLMQRNKKTKYQSRGRETVLKQINGTNHSQSFLKARKMLFDAPCIKG